VRRTVAATPCDISPQLSEIRNAQTQLKEDIRLTVLMLDLVVAHARRASSKTDDARVKQDIADYLASVDDLLDLARQKAIAL
jgi:hypothetical protein